MGGWGDGGMVFSKPLVVLADPLETLPRNPTCEFFPFVCCTETQWGALRAGGRRAGGWRRAVAPTLTPLVSTPTHTHPRLLTHAVGGL